MRPNQSVPPPSDREDDDDQGDDKPPIEQEIDATTVEDGPELAFVVSVVSVLVGYVGAVATGFALFGLPAILVGFVALIAFGLWI